MGSLIARKHASGLLLLCLLPFSTASTAQNADAVQRELLAEIRNERQQLSTTEQRIQQQREGMVARLRSLETDVSTLRGQTAAARRAADEVALSLNQLQTRLDQWREQSQFQHYLLDSYYALVNQQASEQFTSRPLTEKLHWLHRHLDNLLEGIQPQWQENAIILTDGSLATAATLSIGPLAWYLRPESHHGGLLTAGTEAQGDAAGRVNYLFADEQMRGLEQLHASGSGTVTFDPTMSRALALGGQRGGLSEHIAAGGIWVIPILLFALLATGIALVKAVQYWRLPKLHCTGLGDYLNTVSTQLEGAEAELVGIARDTRPGQIRDDRLFGLLMRTRAGLEKWLGAIAVIAAVSPLLGLLGTVSGMIETFELMTLFGAGDPEAVSSGISKALITTELGLVVAIPALLAHAILSRLIRNYLQILENSALELSQLATPTVQVQGAAA